MASRLASGRSDDRCVLGEAIYILNLGYGFEGTFTRLDDFQFVSNSLTGQPSGRVGNRFSGSLLGTIRVPLPKQYVLGIDIQRGDFENYHWLSYLRGQFQDTGWWYYYLYALAIKEPIGTWLLLLLAIISGPVLSVFRWRGTQATSGNVHGPAQVVTENRALQLQHNPRLITIRDELVLILPAALMFASVSSQTGFSKHLRDVLPSVPFVYVWIGSVARLLDKPILRGRLTSNDEGWAFACWPLPPVVITALAWFVASSLWIYPHNLSYFNELVGGPIHGHEHLLGSNLDAGQDLRYFAWWREQHREATPMYLVYEGFNPSSVGVHVPAPPKVLDSTNLRNYQPGWYAVNINSLFTDEWSASGLGRKPRGVGALSPLLALQPDARVGYSIVIFNLDDRPL